MAEQVWQTIKKFHCPKVNQNVALEKLVAYPAEWLPDQPPRVVARRCSYGITCNLSDRPGCIWSGTNPGYDPFV